MSSFDPQSGYPVYGNESTNYGQVPGQQQQQQHQPHFFVPAQPTEPINPSYVPQVQQHQTASHNTYNFDPNSMVNQMTMDYGSAFVAQGTDLVQRSVQNYMSSKLKYYFAVNNAYVAKKLGLLLFPFAHTKWSTAFDQTGPVPPRDDVNAPDLYIPSMAFATYVLLSGSILGIQNRFSPEKLGMLSSEAFGWLVMEVLVFLFCIYLLNVQSTFSYLDVISFCGYKFVSMIAVLTVFVFLDLPGYYFSLLYTSLALSFFLIRTLKLKVLAHADSYEGGNKRRVYLLLVMAIVEPFIVWWLTRRMINGVAVPRFPVTA